MGFEVTTDLWEHQRKCRDFQLDRNHSLNLMGMGEGKTLTTLKLVEERPTSPNLIFCPKAALEVWRRELQKHTNGDYLFLAPTEGTLRDRAKALYDKMLSWYSNNMPVFIALNYACLDSEPMRATLKHFQWGHMIADEVHRLKAPDGKRSQQAFRLGKTAKHRVGLSGTVMPNDPLDLFGVMRFIDVSVLGASYRSFKDQFAVERDGQYGKDIVGFKNQDKLGRILDRVAFQVEEDVLDLPDTVDSFRWGNLPEDIQRRHDERAKELRGVKTKEEVLSVLIRLQKIASGWSPQNWEAIDDTKAKLLVDTLGDIPEEPLVVFANFHKDLDTIRDVLEDRGFSGGELSGRHDDREAFQTGDLDALAVQIDAGSEAIDLTRASTAIFYTPTWSLGTYQQARKRLHRPGQDETVTFIHLVVEETIEETMMEALENKEVLVEKVLDSDGLGML